MLVLSFPIFAQNKVAVINSDAFEDEKAGIKELVDVLKKLDEEFKPKSEELKTIYEKIKELYEKGQKLQREYKGECPIGPITGIQKLADEYENLQNEYTAKQSKYAREYSERKTLLTEPISKRINEKLKIFIKQKGYTTVFDISKDNSSYTIIENFENLPNITKEFIEFCNAEFEKEKAQQSK